MFKSEKHSPILITNYERRQDLVITCEQEILHFLLHMHEQMATTYLLTHVQSPGGNKEMGVICSHVAENEIVIVGLYKRHVLPLFSAYHFSLSRQHKTLAYKSHKPLVEM